MTYIVLARKWRPMIFEDVVGQQHVTRTLMNALKNQRIAHSYIFAGPRGIGKTTTARLLAKAVNCEKQPAVNPCNECASCKAITSSHSMDVIEIDGASNRGIDEIRNLRENIRFAPSSSRFKIYIIDEVHMLTKEAFNALLKTLEEPPSHAIFIFATTEIHKVPLTIMSRCQRFDFKRISTTQIREQLQKIVSAENIEIEEDAQLLIARKADGSMRDAESILDQMISYSDGKITVGQLRQSLGLIDQEIYFEFTDLLRQKNTADILKFAGKVVASGHENLDFLHGLQEHFRNYLIVRSLQNSKLLEVADHYRTRYEETATAFEEQDLIHYIYLIQEAEQNIKFSTFPQLSLEMLLLKIVHKPPAAKLEEVLAFIENLKKNSQGIEPAKQPADSAGSEGRKEGHFAKDEVSGLQERTSTQQPAGTAKKPAGIGYSGQFQSLEKTVSGYREIQKPSKAGKKKEIETKLDLDEINKLWPDIVEKVRSQKVALGSFLQEGIPYEMDQDKLTLIYDESAEFHQEHVKNNRRVVEDIIGKQFQINLRLDFRTVNFKTEGIRQQPRTPEEVIQDIKNKEPIIDKIIKVFDLDESGNMKV